MSEQRHTSATPCTDIEDILVRQRYEQITEHEQTLVRRHLGSCGCCQTFEATLTAIPQTIATSCGAHLQPMPVSRERILNRMQTLHRERPGRFWQPLHRIATMRIPVYQAVIGIAAMLTITFIGINGQRSANRAYDSSLSGTVFADTTVIHKHSALPQFDMRDSLQIRRNVQEDSLISKYYRGMYDTLLTDGRLKSL